MGEDRHPDGAVPRAREQIAPFPPGLRLGSIGAIMPLMQWTAPTYAEIKMDAEIGSYQEDHEPTREVPFAEGSEGDAAEASAAS